MKRRSSLTNRRLYGPRSRTLFSSPAALGGAALVLIGIVVLAVRLVAPDVIYSWARPLWNAGDTLTAAAGTRSTALKGADALARQNDALTAQNAALAAQNAALAAQVADLTATLGSRQAPAPGIVAGVLAGPPVAPYDELVVDQGSAAGVTVGAAAFGPSGTPLGRVSAVSARGAHVQLFSSPGVVTTGWAGDQRLPLTLHGIGAGAYEATVPRDEGIAVGAAVYVPGPGALPIGTVSKVDTDPSSPQAVVHVRPYVNPFSVTWVTIAP